MLDVRPARPADAVVIRDLRDAAARRLTARGIRQWLPGEMSLLTVAGQVRAGEWFVHEAGGGIAGVLRLVWSDDEVWGQHPDANRPAGYVHGLVVDPQRARRGLGAALLDWAADRVAARGRAMLRLDCVESNERLRRYYREYGFTEVGRREFDSAWFPCVLLQRRLPLLQKNRAFAPRQRPEFPAAGATETTTSEKTSSSGGL